MGKAMFYHLTDKRPEQVVAMLAERSLDAGWRVYVRGLEFARLSWLDEALWTVGGDEAFLPHGLEGGPEDAEQPVLLGTGTVAVNDATVLVTIDGAPVDAGDVAAMERVCILFDGTAQDALTLARGQWKALTDAGVHAEYWSQESGQWAKKAEKGAPDRQAARR